MTNYPLLTIVIPVFNTAKLLTRCLDSLLNQVNKKCKILLINDCSTDNSLDIITQYSNKYCNIDFISLPKQSGAGNARNEGLKKVKTKYVCFLDSDDWIDSNSYEKVIRFLEKHQNCDIALFGVKMEYKSPFLSKFKCNYEYTNIIEGPYALTIFCKTINYDLYISSMLGNKVFRTKLLKNNNIRFQHIYFEDVYFSFVTFFYSRYICIIENTYLHYYQRYDSIMHSFSIHYIDGLFDVLIDVKKFLIDNGCFGAYQKEYFALFNKCIYSLMNIIFSENQNDTIQKKYILYLVTTLTKKFDIAELINNLDILLIKEIFNK